MLLYPCSASSARPRLPAPRPLLTAAHQRCRAAIVVCFRSAPSSRRAAPQALPAAAPGPGRAVSHNAGDKNFPIVSNNAASTADNDESDTGGPPFACSADNDTDAAVIDTDHRRLELLALDVEFTHVQLPGGTRRSLATWVCLVDRFGGVPLKAHIALPPELEGTGTAGEAPGGALPPGTRVVGGVPRSALVGAQPLDRIRESLLALLRRGRCRTLVGHGLTKDLRALGVGERAAATLRRRHGVKLYDTMSHGKFRGRGGTARPLARLAAELLDGRVIQAGGSGRHDPEEDARAVLDLYVRYVDLSYYMERETARLIEEHRRRSAAAVAAAEDEGEGEEDGEGEASEGDGVEEDGTGEDGRTKERVEQAAEDGDAGWAAAEGTWEGVSEGEANAQAAGGDGDDGMEIGGSETRKR